MLSLTWNAPIETFDDPQEFFHGVGVDAVYLHFHKINEYLGTTALPTYICNDVMKSPDIPAFLNGYRAHLQSLFGGS